MHKHVFCIDECLDYPGIRNAFETSPYEWHSISKTLNMSGASDHDIARMCIENNWIVVTENTRDFHKLYGVTEWNPGILNVKKCHMTDNEKCRRLSEFLQFEMPLLGANDLCNKSLFIRKYGTAWMPCDISDTISRRLAVVLRYRERHTSLGLQYDRHVNPVLFINKGGNLETKGLPIGTLQENQNEKRVQ